MGRCGLKILGIFGGLLILAAFFFVPVHRQTVSEQIGASGIGTRTTWKANEYVALPIYLRARGLHIAERTGAKVTTTLRPVPYLVELGVIAFLGLVDFGLFCFLLRRKSV
jgi:hypothetical protein